MKAVVSGGAGFIGSHLVEHLITNDYEVVVLDNLSTGRMENLEFIKSKVLRVHTVDISDVASIKSYFNDVDCVFHLAALADIVPSIERPLEYHRSNVDGTISVLEAARNSGVKRFVYAASSSCYGIQKAFPTDEEDSIQPAYPYALTKHIGEQYVLHWGKVYGLPVVSLRLFNIYGPRSRTSGAYGAVFGVFLAQKLAGEKLTIVGDGTQTRDFLFVKDAVRAFRMAAESEVTNGVFNVGSGRTYSVNRLADLLGGERVFIPRRPGEPDCTHANISKIERVLKWHPEVSFEEGVNIMLQRIEYWRDAPVWTPETIEKTTKIWFKYLSK